MNEPYYISSRETINSRFNKMIKELDVAIQDNGGFDNTDIIIRRTFWNSLSDKQRDKLQEYVHEGVVMNIEIF